MSKQPRACYFTIASLVIGSGAIVLSAYLLLGSSGYGALAAAGLIEDALPIALLVSFVAAAIAMVRSEACQTTANACFAISGLLLLFLLLLISPDSPPQLDEKQPPGTFRTRVIPMDHEQSDTFVRNVRVDGQLAGDAARGKPASSRAGYAPLDLPYAWKRGLSATVQWERCDKVAVRQLFAKEPVCRTISTVVPIHKYDYEVSHAWLHLLPGDKAQFVIGLLYPGDAGYPGPDVVEPRVDDIVYLPMRIADDMRLTYPLSETDDYSYEIHVDGAQFSPTSEANGEIGLTYQWSPDERTVKWRRCHIVYGADDTSSKRDCRWFEQSVPVQKYESLASTVWVHFTDDNQVQLTMRDPYVQQPDTPE